MQKTGEAHVAYLREDSCGVNAGVAEAASCSFLCLSSLFSVLLARIAAMLSLWWLCGVIPFLHARNGE